LILPGEINKENSAYSM